MLSMDAFLACRSTWATNVRCNPGIAAKVDRAVTIDVIEMTEQASDAGGDTRIG